jgi:hypothetical protein
MLTPLDLCSTEDHGRHLNKEKAVADKIKVYAPLANSVKLEIHEARQPTQSAGSLVLAAHSTTHNVKPDASRSR